MADIIGTPAITAVQLREAQIVRGGPAAGLHGKFVLTTAEGVALADSAVHVFSEATNELAALLMQAMEEDVASILSADPPTSDEGEAAETFSTFD